MEPITITLAVGVTILNAFLSAKQAQYQSNVRNKLLEDLHNKNKEHIEKVCQESHDFHLKLVLQQEEGRIRQMCEDFSNEVQQILDHHAIQKWPMTILPVAILNEKVGNSFGGGTDYVSLNCIVTPSNCQKFNAGVYPFIDKEIQDFFNSFYNVQSNHAVYFFGGAWPKPYKAPTGPELDHIKARLRRLPTLLITPFFRENEVSFKVCIWGIGDSIPLKFEVQPKNSIYQHVFSLDYVLDFDYTGVFDTAILEFTAFIEGLIALYADQYYYAYYDLNPLLPQMLVKNNIPDINELLHNFLKAQCVTTLKQWIDFKKECVDYLDDPERLISLIDSMKPILTDAQYQASLDQVIHVLAYQRGEMNGNLSTADLFAKEELFLPTDSRFISLMAGRYAFDESPLPDITDLNPEDYEMDYIQYPEKRDEMLDIMQKVVAIEGVSKERELDFLRIRKKCLESQFNLVLLSEFQAGKSTTFDALCGGRELSPRGIGVPTSACVISAQFLDSTEEEYAIVTWKNDYELLLCIEPLLTEIDPLEAGWKGKEDEPFNPIEFLSLSNSKNLSLIKNTISYLWENSETLNDEQKDILKIATIILTYYGSKELEDIKKKGAVKTFGQSRMDIDAASSLAVFPQCWAEWKHASMYCLKDVLFPFVACIEFHLHSPALRRLGCTVYDCPGLMSSAWDSRITLEILKRADAVICLLPSHAISQAHKSIFKIISTNDFLRSKVFFAINIKLQTKIESVISADMDTLKSMGFESPKLCVFNSLLFYLGNFAEAYLKGNLPYSTLERFREVHDVTSDATIESAWLYEVRTCLHIMKKNRTVDSSNMDLKTAHAVIEASRVEDLLLPLEQYIVDQKSYQILINGGANIIRHHLVAWDRELFELKKAATENIIEAEASYKHSRKILDKFQMDVRSILDDSFGNGMNERVVKTAYSTIFTAELISKMAESCVIEIDKTVKFKQGLSVAKKKFLEVLLEVLPEDGTITKSIQNKIEEYQKDLLDIVKPALTTVAEHHLGIAFHTWSENLCQGKDDSYQLIVLPEIKRIYEKINDIWRNSLANDPSIEPFEIPQAPDVDPTYLHQMTGISDGIGGESGVTAAMNSLNIVFNQIVAGIVGAIIAVLLTWWNPIFILTGIAIFLSSILGTGRQEIYSKSDFNKKQMKMYHFFVESFNKFYYKDVDESQKRYCAECCEKLAVIPQGIFNEYKDYYLKALEVQKKVFDANIEEKRGLKALSVEEKQLKINEWQEKRIRVLRPLIERLKIFIDSCRKSSIGSQP